MGTSHNLGQNFARAFDITFQTAEGGLDHVWSTSWGSSTRMVGGLIMAHGDDKGLVCPPRLAQYQVVIVPIYRGDADRAGVLEGADKVARELKAVGLRVHIDGREGVKPGAKYYEWETRGAPFRLELGPRDLAAGTAMLARRDGGPKEPLALGELAARLPAEVEAMQLRLLDVARTRRDDNTLRRPAGKGEFIEYIAQGGGFVLAGWNGDPAVEAEIKEATKATIRVLPDEEFRPGAPAGRCIWTGEPAKHEALWAKAY
jgi:prolyl-tRNA synthetase